MHANGKRSTATHSAMTLLGTAAMFGATVLALLNFPDLLRYVRMRRM